MSGRQVSRKPKLKRSKTMNARTQLAIVILLFLALVVLLKIDRELSRERELSRIDGSAIILAEAMKKINQLAFLVNEREMLDGETTETTDDCIVEQEGQLQILDALDCLIEKMNRQNIRIMKQRKESE